MLWCNAPASILHNNLHMSVILLRPIAYNVPSIADAPHLPAADVGVDARRLQPRMPQQLLDVTDISASLVQVGGKGVAQGVHSGILLYPLFTPPSSAQQRRWQAKMIEGVNRVLIRELLDSLPQPLE